MLQKILEIMFSHGRWMMILQGLGTTLLIAFCAVLMGTILGCIFAIFKLSNSKILNAISNVYTTLIRGIPMATQLMICYFVIFSPLGVRNTVLVAIISFGVNSGAYCTEIFRAGINGVDKGQMEAGRSLGLNWAQTMFAVIIPQAFKTILPTFASEFITLIKETSESVRQYSQCNLQRLGSAPFLRPGLSYSYSWSYKDFFCNRNKSCQV